MGAWVRNGHKGKDKKSHIQPLSLPLSHTHTHQKEIDSVIFFTVFPSSNSTTAVNVVLKPRTGSVDSGRDVQDRI